MLFCIFIAVAFTFAVADDCFDPAKLIAKVKPVHDKCRSAVISLKATQPDAKDCDFANFVYGVCNNRELNINDKYQQKDHAKFVDFLKSFSAADKKDGLTSKLSVCGTDALVKNGNAGPYFDCLQKQCPEVEKIRADYVTSRNGIC